MLRVTVELIPFGIESNKRKLATMEIENDLTGDVLKGNYKGTIYAEYTHNAGRVGYVKKYDRTEQPVWSLVGAFLKLFGHTKHSLKLMELE